MPARGSTNRAVRSRINQPNRQAARTSIPPTQPSNVTVASGLPSEPLECSDQDVDDVAARFLAVSLNDEGPDVNSHNHGLWMSRAAFQEECRRTDSVPDRPADVPMGDILNSLTHLTHVSSTTPPMRSRSPLSRIERAKLKKERNFSTKKVHEVFDGVDKQITTLSAELDAFTRSPTHKAFTDINSKLTSMQAVFERNKRSTESLDKKKASLIPRLIALQDRIQELRHFLPPEDDGPREYPCGEHLNSFPPFAILTLRNCRTPLP